MENLRTAIKLSYPVINVISNDTELVKLNLELIKSELNSKINVKLINVEYKFIPNKQNIQKILNENKDADKIIIYDPLFSFKPKEKIPTIKEVVPFLEENGITYIISDTTVKENEVYNVRDIVLDEEKIKQIIEDVLDNSFYPLVESQYIPIFEEKEITKLVNLFKGMSIPEIKNYAIYSAYRKYIALMNDENVDIFAEVKKEKAEILRNYNLELLESISPEEIGGMDNLKKYMNIIKNAWDKNLPLKGLFLRGIPGTGKTAFAKVVANILDVPLIKFDISKMFNKYVGESERQIYEVLHRIEAFAPMVLLIDEIDKIFKANTDMDGGVSSRVMGIILSWLQERKEKIYLIATANGPIPLEMQRSGRFDRLFFVDIPNKEERKSILEVHLEKMKKITGQNYKVNIKELVKMTQYFTGAEIEQFVKEAFYYGLDKKTISMKEFKAVIDFITPVYKIDPEKVAEIRELKKLGFVPSNTKPVEEDYIEETNELKSKRVINF